MNKCSRCLGTGLLLCGPCGGTGTRIDGLGGIGPCKNCGGSGHTTQVCGCGVGKRKHRLPR